MIDRELNVDELVAKRNNEKFLFTAGPAALLTENIIGLRPCFGRGDSDYEALENRVLTALKKISGHSNLVRMQGSASLALEIMTLNFSYGRVLIVDTGYYSKRMLELAKSSQRSAGQVTEIRVTSWDKIENVDGKFDWIIACSTETSCGIKLQIEWLRSIANRLSAKLMLDATASIGLEDGHELADVIAYSSCKGLFGLTGAAFIAYHNSPTVEIDSFYLDMKNHIEKKMTGPYHSIASLDNVLKNHDQFREAVVVNKYAFVRRMQNYLTYPEEFQPLLCTKVECNVTSRDPRTILYSPRTNTGGSVVCHLGEVYMGRAAKGQILSLLECKE